MLDMAEVIQIFLSPSYVCKHGTRQKGSYGKPDPETAAKKKEGLLSLESWARKKILTSQHVHAVLHAKIRYYGS